MKQIFTSLSLCILLFASCNHSLPAGRFIEPKQISLTLKNPVPDNFIPLPYTIVTIGDSLTKGVGDSTNAGGYTPYLEEFLENEKGVKEVQIYNYGVSGDRTSQVLNRLQNMDIKNTIEKADIIMLTTGGNDIMKVVRDHFFSLELEFFDKELKSYEKSLDSVLQLIRNENPEALICLIGLYNPFHLYFPHIKEMNIVLDNWNDTSQSVLSSYENTLYVKIDDIFKESEENLLYTDFFHPNDKGYERIAERVYTNLQKADL